jgi:hypothetical protein
MSVIYNYRMQQRVDTFANWTVANPILASGEIAFVNDQNKMKVGDGVQSFNALPYITDNINTDNISEKTAGAGVTVDGVLFKDGDVTAGRRVNLKDVLPTLDFEVTNGVTTHNNVWFITTSDAFQIQTRDNSNTFVANDYLLDRNGTGATKHRWRIANVDKLIIDSSGNTSIKGLASAEQGISFDNGTNTLEHYEEGTFTPQYSFVNTPTYTTQTGKYTRIGNILYFTLKIEVSSLDNTDTSNIHVTGLPFNASQLYQINASLNPNQSTILADYLQTTDAVYFGQLNNTTAIQLQNGDGDYIKYSHIKSSGSLTITGWYFV